MAQTSISYGNLLLAFLLIVVGMSFIIATYFFPGMLKPLAPNYIVVSASLLFVLGGIMVALGTIWGPGTDMQGNALPGASPAIIIVHNVLGTIIWGIFTGLIFWGVFGSGKGKSYDYSSIGGITQNIGNSFSNLLFSLIAIVMGLLFLSSLYYTIKSIWERLI
jgi:hypothetical protein